MGKNPKKTAEQVLDELGATWSPDAGAYAAGEIGVSGIRCVLCGTAPCSCPPRR